MFSLESFLNTQMRDSIVLEQSRTQILDRSLAQLSNSVNLLTGEVSVLKDYSRKLAENMQRWSGSFKSLLKDVIRHNDVLGLLLGQEVQEFLELPIKDQREYSILALKEQLGLLHEQLRSHNLSISSLLALQTGEFSNIANPTYKSRTGLGFRDLLVKHRNVLDLQDAVIIHAFIHASIHLSIFYCLFQRLNPSWKFSILRQGQHTQTNKHSHPHSYLLWSVGAVKQYPR